MVKMQNKTEKVNDPKYVTGIIKKSNTLQFKDLFIDFKSDMSLFSINFKKVFNYNPPELNVILLYNFNIIFQCITYKNKWDFKT